MNLYDYLTGDNMNFINNSIINFSLHECYIDSIYVEKSY